MKRRPIQNRWADILHKSFVAGCVGLTLYGMLIVGTRSYYYFTQIKPKRLEEQRIREEQENVEMEDTAPTLKL